MLLLELLVSLLKLELLLLVISERQWARVLFPLLLFPIPLTGKHERKGPGSGREPGLRARSHGGPTIFEIFPKSYHGQCNIPNMEKPTRTLPRAAWYRFGKA